MADVNITVDGKKLTAAAGELLIEVCKRHGIEIPAFCYYPGLSLQGACRMCLVRIEKMPKLQTACTTGVTEGMVVTTNSNEIRQARRAMLEMLLANHPLDCPVCDAGGQCELQDMTFKYGAGESKFIDIKNHREEQQWSPVVFFDRPRCILCYRCVRVCGEGMDVWALGVQQRGVNSIIAPNGGDHLECEECGMCIDICPVGALTSGAYRYKTRPWEMKHTGTVCMFCADGCKTTLGVRRTEGGTEIVRGDNRDKSGINGDFLCIKGRYAFDVVNRGDRLREPLVREGGKLAPATWEKALTLVASKLKQIRDEFGPESVGVVGGNRLTNEEAYLLQKFARLVLKTNNIDHHWTTDYPALAAALNGKAGMTATMREVLEAPAILVVGGNPTEEHPLLAWQIRTNVRQRRARLYVVNAQPIKLRRQAEAFLQIPAGSEAKAFAYLNGDDATLDGLLVNTPTLNAPMQGAEGGTPDAREKWNDLREKLRGEQGLIVIFGAELRSAEVAAAVQFASGVAGAKLICLGDHANSRGVADMGLFPHLLPGYVPVSRSGRAEWMAEAPTAPGMNLRQMVQAAGEGKLKALYIVGSNPVESLKVDPTALRKPFTVVQELFLTETAMAADVVLPAAAPYEKAGSYTNACGDLQLISKAAELAGTRADFDILVRVAERMDCPAAKLVPHGGALRADLGQSRGPQSGEADRHAVWLAERGLMPKVSPFDPLALLDEIQRLVPGYDVSRRNLLGGGDEHTTAVEQGGGALEAERELIAPAHDTLFTSGTLGRYSETLNSVMENERREPAKTDVPAD
jgi:NADH-quinone oxidoreductase subunit G